MQLAGYRTRVLRAGPAGGEVAGDGPGPGEPAGDEPPFLLLHGWGDSADSWRPAMIRLARAGVASVAVDFPGHGAADELRPGELVPQADAVTEAMLRRYGGERTLVAGYSLGGFTWLREAQRPGTTVAGVVALAPPGIGRPWWYAPIERGAPIGRLALRVPWPLPGRVVSGVAAELYRRIAFASPAGIDPEALGVYAGHWPSRGVGARRLRALLDLLTELGTTSTDLDAVPVPVLLVWGDRDRIVPLTPAQRACGERWLEVIPDCGHVAPIEATDRIVELLLRFRERVGGEAEPSVDAEPA